MNPKFLKAHTAELKCAAMAAAMSVGIDCAPLTNGVFMFCTQYDEQAFSARVFNSGAPTRLTKEILDALAFGDAVRLAALNSMNAAEKKLLKKKQTWAIFQVAVAISQRLDLALIASTVTAFDREDMQRTAEILTNVATRKNTRGIAELEARIAAGDTFPEFDAEQ